MLLNEQTNRNCLPSTKYKARRLTAKTQGLPQGATGLRPVARTTGAAYEAWSGHVNNAVAYELGPTAV